MASEVRFDRDAVGIKAQAAWTDNQMFINIADGIGELSLAAVSGVTTLPIDTVGSTLGSGAETAIGNMDAAESQVTQDFAFMMSSKPQ